MLKRYWLIFFPDNKYGLGNFGVTAFSSEQAKSLAKEVITDMGWTHISEKAIEKTEVIENIDVRELDENHVRPNMGVVSRLGVWFPNCNS